MVERKVVEGNVDVEGVEVDMEIGGVDVEGVEEDVARDVEAEAAVLVLIAFIVRMLPSSTHVASIAMAIAQSASMSDWSVTPSSESESTMIGIGATNDVIATFLVSVMAQM